MFIRMYNPHNSTDVKRLNRIAMKAVNSGIIIVGGGVIKHHICNANLMVRRLFSTYYLGAYMIS